MKSEQGKNKKKSTEQAVCSISKKCGSCQYQGMSYHKQLQKKQRQEESLLGGYGKVEPIIGMKNPYYYRNKVHAVFDRDRRGNVISGTYEAKSHRVVAVENCLIEDQKSQEIIHTIKNLLKSFKIKTYDEDTGYGLLRHVMVRRGFKSGGIMVILVLGSPILPSKNNFVKALRKEHPEITTVVLNVNDKKTSMVLGEKEKPIYGPGFIKDELCGCTFRISPKSFYQVNPVQTEILYNTAIEYAGLKGKETIIDACNGVQREHNKKLNNGLPILHKVPPKRDYGRYFCIMAEKGGTSHGGLTEKLSPFFHAKKQEVNAYGR